MAEPTHYEVLALPRALLEDTSPEQVPTLIKQAYHRALLRHHPDKAPQPPKSNTTSSSFCATTSPARQPTYTIDQITTAHATLSSPALRAAYDAHLRTAPPGRYHQQQRQQHGPDASFQTGVETVDLDDLACDDGGEGEGEGEGEPRWYRPCRCGNERGFAFGEADLEEAGDLGELLVGCLDCSLWLRVCFSVVEEDGADDEEPVEKGPGDIGGSAGKG